MAQCDPKLKILVDRISAAVKLKNVKKITQQIKNDLEDLISKGQLMLPDNLSAAQFPQR